MFCINHERKARKPELLKISRINYFQAVCVLGIEDILVIFSLPDQKKTFDSKKCPIFHIPEMPRHITSTHTPYPSSTLALETFISGSHFQGIRTEKHHTIVITMK